LVARGRRRLSSTSGFGGAKTGPSPVNRRKLGSKYHLITDARGVPLAYLVTAANRPEVLELLPLVDAIPPVRGKRGRPKRRPAALVGDRGYYSKWGPPALRARGIQPRIAAQLQPHGSGLGKQRWVVERSFSWLRQYRRLRTRYERSVETHEAFLSIACSLICLRALHGSF
jgi:transposase